MTITIDINDHQDINECVCTSSNLEKVHCKDLSKT